VAKKETVFHNEIVFLFFFFFFFFFVYVLKKIGKGGSVKEEQRLYTHLSGMKWKQKNIASNFFVGYFTTFSMSGLHRVKMVG
jgi:hypothetical protein